MKTDFGKRLRLLSPWAILLAVTVLSSAQSRSAKSSQTSQNSVHQTSSASAENGKSVERGKYIVEGLSRCSQCHTPRDSRGIPDPNKPLEGAAVWLQSAIPTENWPLQAPRIAGDPPGTDAELVKLLTTGIWRDGHPLRQPMPQFRMTEQDAMAVIAYLRSLNPSQ